MGTHFGLPEPNGTDEHTLSLLKQEQADFHRALIRVVSEMNSHARSTAERQKELSARHADISRALRRLRAEIDARSD